MYKVYDIKYDPKPMLAEAISCREFFQEHGNAYYPGWKSLGLNAPDGNYKTTYIKSDIGVNFQPTEMVDRCPLAWQFVNEHFKNLRRVRINMLEPGGRLPPHKDNGPTINASLNNPKDCELWLNTNKDGTRNDDTITLPYSDNGEVIWFDRMVTHLAFNNSKIDRYHLIVHGDLK